METLQTLMSDQDMLAGILKYHVVEGKVLAADVKPGMVPTLNGAEIEVTVTDDGTVMLNDAAKVIETDIMASNGVIHIIDAVITPPEEPAADALAGCYSGSPNHECFCDAANCDEAKCTGNGMIWTEQCGPIAPCDCETAAEAPAPAPESEPEPKEDPEPEPESEDDPEPEDVPVVEGQEEDSAANLAGRGAVALASGVVFLAFA